MKRVAVAIGAFVGAPACALLIDLEELPERGAAPDASTDRAIDVALDTFVPDATLFADDFDRPGQRAGDGWQGYKELFFDAVTLRNDAGAAVVTPASTPAPPTPPAVLEAQGVREGSVAFAYLVHRIDLAGGAARAVEVSAQVRLLELTDLRDGGVSSDDAGPPIVYQHPRLQVLGLVAPVGADGEIAEVLLSSRYVGLSTARLLGAGTDVYGVAAERASGEESYVDLSASVWIGVTLAAGARDAILARAEATKRHTPSCPDAPAVGVVWPSLPQQTSVCMKLSDNFAALAGGGPIAVTAGLSIGDRAAARVHLDNVRVVAIP